MASAGDRPSSAAVERPRLSIVVPVFNVEQYLAACLDSLLGQSFQDFELILVNDGSADDSCAIAERYLDRHRRMQLVHTSNRGLAAARNTGAALAEGQYLAFVDSDDTVPQDAYEVMIATLDRTGSDFAAGSVRWLGGDSDGRVPHWVGRLHRQRRVGLRLAEFPEIMHDILAPTKVFRRDFWERSALRFPEGLRYEDQVAITEAYLKAGTIDVLQRPVYNWRVRGDETSITQRRHELSNLRDRLLTKAMTSDIVRRLGCEQAQGAWFYRGLAGDLPRFFAHVPGCGDDYWECLSSGIRELFSGTAGIEDSALPPAQRLVGWLIAHGRREQASLLVQWLSAVEGSVPAEIRDGAVLMALPFRDDPSADIPLRLFVVRQSDLCWNPRLIDISWRETNVDITVDAPVKGLSGLTVDAVRAWAASPAGDQRELRCRREGSQVVVSLDVRDVLPTTGSWTVRLGCTVGSLDLSATIDGPAGRLHTSKQSRRSQGDCSARFHWDNAHRLAAVVEPATGAPPVSSNVTSGQLTATRSRPA